MITELTITAKGQVTLKKSVLDHLGLKPGEKVRVDLRPDGRVELQPVGKKRDVASLRGLLWRPEQKTVTIEEMQEAIEEGATERYQRSL